MPTTGLRFFTVYGPWGRPDMALFLFTTAILENQPINLFNRGDMIRDFTYVDDLVEAIVRLAQVPPERPAVGSGVPEGDSLSPVAPYRVVNIGNADPVPLMEFIAAIETATGRVLAKDFQPMQPGDVPDTWADVSLLKRLTGYAPSTPIADGVARFIAWYRAYNGPQD